MSRGAVGTIVISAGEAGCKIGTGRHRLGDSGTWVCLYSAEPAPRRPGGLGAAGASPVTVVVGQPEELERQLRPIGIVEPQVVGLACDAIRVDLDLAGPVDVHGVCPGGLRMIGVRQMGMQDVGPLLYLFPEVRVAEDGVRGAVPQLHARAWPVIARVRRPGEVPPLLRRLDDVAVSAGG